MERDTIFYLLNRNAPERQFISAVIVGGGLDEIVIQFTRRGLGLVVDEEISLHFKHEGHFLHRSFQVMRVTEDSSGTRVKVVPMGAEPEENDLRGSERIPTIYESITARLGDEKDCIVLDVSTRGIAVMGGGGYGRDEEVEFEMQINGQDFLGQVNIRSSIEIRPGRYRYGVQVVPDMAGHNLSATLPDLWVALQIKYLETVLI